MFANYEEMTTKLTQAQILTIVNTFVRERSKRSQYHKAYNTRIREDAREYRQLKATTTVGGTRVELS